MLDDPVAAAAVAVLVAVSMLVIAASPALAQAAAAEDSPRPDGSGVARAAYVELGVRRELLFTSLGAGLLAGSYAVPSPRQPVPVEGFSDRDIAWSWDRGYAGTVSSAARDASNLSRDAAAALPLVLAWFTADDGERWHDATRSGVVYVETMLITGGLTRLAKAAIGRPRPYLYLPLEDRPSWVSDPVDVGAFYSLPSGHTSIAWAGAGMALADHMLRRPDAHWAERVGVGFLGGAFAGATAGLRVQAGSHFPSDVIAGAALGTAVGITVPLAHRGSAQLPSSRDWLQGVGGVVFGTVVGLAVARTY